MATDVSICNNALVILGAEPSLIALSDENERGRTFTAVYASVRDNELRQRRWHFALKRDNLPVLALAPANGFAYAYQLPNDCLRVIQVGEYDLGPDLSDYRSSPTDLYSIEGKEVQTDLGAPLAIRYIAQIRDAGTFDASFAELLAAALAKRVCYRVTQSNQLLEQCKEEYKRAARAAALANAFERPSNSPTDDTWMAARTR